MVNLDYLYNPDAAKAYFGKNYFVDKKLGFQVIEKGMILPHKDVWVNGKWTLGKGGIVNSNGEFINDSFIHPQISGAYTPPPESIQHSNQTVIYLGLWFPVWGHIITDDIRFLWFLKSDAFKSEFKNCPIVYVPWDRTTIDTFPDFKRLIEILEVDVDKLQPITQPTTFDKIILPNKSFKSYHHTVLGFTNEFRETVDRVRSYGLKHSTPTSAKKLYFFHGKKGQFGEDRIAEYLKSKGYEIVNPGKQKLSFDEELNLLVNCESFAAGCGSSSLNSLFLRNGTETIFIPRIAYQFDLYQQIADQVHPLNINYVDSTLSVLSKRIDQGVFFYVVSERLKSFFGDKWNGYEEEDFKNFLQYAKHYLRKGLEINPNLVNAYGKINSARRGRRKGIRHSLSYA